MLRRLCRCRIRETRSIALRKAQARGRAHASGRQELHFGRAARRLGVVQPALSRTIRALEEDVGSPVVTRDRRAVALTPAGEALLEYARAAWASAEAALRAA